MKMCPKCVETEKKQTFKKGLMVGQYIQLALDIVAVLYYFFLIKNKK
jgi:hypothetical protein